MLKNALYLRLSLADGDLGKNNKDESNSIENQRTLLVNFLQDRDDLADEYIEYVDDGYTGTNFERPEFKRMIEDAKSGKIDTIIVKDFSRFGRDYIGVGDYLEQILPILGIRFISINNNYDSNDYLGKTMGMDMAIHNLVNNLYSKDISKKIKSALRVKWKNGQWTGGKPPFGYLRDTETGEWVIDPVAGKYVRAIFDKAIEGCNTTQIMYYMNEQKIPTPGKYNKENGLTHYGYNQKLPETEVLWDCGMIRTILCRYEYTGALVQGKRQSVSVGSKITRKSKYGDMVITKNVHPAIVSEEEYELAKATIMFMNKPGYRGTRKFALKGKLRCGNCRRSMVLMESGANDKVYCPHKKLTGKFSKCSDEAVPVMIIEGHVWYALQQVLYVLDMIREDIEEKANALDGVRKKKLKQLELENDKLKSERMRQYEAYAEEIITKDKYLLMKQQLTDKVNRNETEMERLTHLSVEESAYKNKVASAIELLDGEMQHEKITQELVDATIDTVYVYDKKRIEVVFKFDDILMRAIEKYQKGEKEA